MYPSIDLNAFIDDIKAVPTPWLSRPQIDRVSVDKDDLSAIMTELVFLRAFKQGFEEANQRSYTASEF